MIPENITYTNRAVMLQERIWLQRVSNGDAEALLELICARTDISREDALKLDVDDTKEIMEKVTAGLLEYINLVKLGRAQ